MLMWITSLPNSPKTKRGANGKFLPQPFSICDIQIQKQISQSFGKSFPQKIVLPKLRPHCSATCPDTWRAEPQKKMSFPLSRKISPPPNQESEECFSFGVAEALRGSGGTIRAYDLVSSHHALRACALASITNF